MRQVTQKGDPAYKKKRVGGMTRMATSSINVILKERDAL